MEPYNKMAQITRLGRNLAFSSFSNHIIRMETRARTGHPSCKLVSIPKTFPVTTRDWQPTPFPVFISIHIWNSRWKMIQFIHIHVYNNTYRFPFQMMWPNLLGIPGGDGEVCLSDRLCDSEGFARRVALEGEAGEEERNGEGQKISIAVSWRRFKCYISYTSCVYKTWLFILNWHLNF